MVALTEHIIHFLNKHNIAVVSTANGEGRPNISLKGIAKIDPKGIIYILDLYHQKTRKNLEENPQLSIACFSEEAFQGCQFKGKAKIVEIDKVPHRILKTWDRKIIQRITDRVIKNIQKERPSHHFEATHLPKPKYLIKMTVEEIIDLRPKLIS